MITHAPRDARHQVRGATRRALVERDASAGAEQAALAVGEQRFEVFFEAVNGRRDEDGLELLRERAHDAALHLDADAWRWRFDACLELVDQGLPLAPPTPG